MMRTTPRSLLLSAGACVVAFFVLLGGVYHTAPGRWLDNAALDGFLAAQGPRMQPIAAKISSICDPGPFALIALAIVVVAAIKRGPRRAAAAAALLLGATVTTQILKPLLAEVRFDRGVVGSHHFIDPVIPAPAFPSGHATAAMSIALALVIVSPRAWRPIAAAVGGLFALAVSFSIVTLGWHFPSDIVGGYLVATTWCLTLLAGLRAAEQRWPERGSLRDAARRAVAPREALKVVGILGAFGAAIASGIGLAKLDRVAQFADRHTTATVAAVTISLCAAGVVAGITMVTSRRQ
jgi:membrane-associated phospholipid phosphatase